ncbi:flagellar brake protein [Oceanobacillus chungangensis]|uniref:Flagellar brake protein n=1 Tax=Oceanobacillus chungangensis TaxID=1229152 RepID=A0A3D8Q1W7_9BACI|nr:flagellar brake domain-containing protein [Oceanobacillus chungangensis]RDW22032.1 flagellar brake protein [Oceanobacillus chungangensis]
MKIGTVLHIELKNPKTNKNDKYRCKVIEMNELYLIIDYPVNEITNKTTVLPKRKHFSVSYIGEDEAVYQFNSSITSKIKLNVPALAIEYPKKENIRRIQRREFVRIETTVDVAIHSIDQAFSPFVTVTSDISGGGISIIAPNGHKLVIGDIVETWLTLQMHEDKYHYINMKTKVVFIKTLKSSIELVSLKFIELDQLSQQAIIRFCFEKQREARQKEMS